VRPRGDAESSLGDVKSSLGDARSSLGDAKRSLGDAKRFASLRRGRFRAYFLESRLERRPKAAATSGLEVSAGWARSSARGIWGGDASAAALHLTPWAGVAWGRGGQQTKMMLTSPLHPALDDAYTNVLLPYWNEHLLPGQAFLEQVRPQRETKRGAALAERECSSLAERVELPC
jgi:hypothetical protein